jgi:lipid-A-disaccharide synthase
VGNPTAEEMKAKSKRVPVRSKKIAILPGSRKSEVKYCLERMLHAARRFKDYEIIVTAAPGIEDAYYTPYLQEGEQLTRDTYDALLQAQAAIVNSGTATLETALLGCPQVAVYHLALTPLIRALRWMQPLIFSIPYFTLVNIISGKEVIKECIANDFTEEKVVQELARLLKDESYTKKMLANYEHLSQLLGDQPAASGAAAIITSRQ